jgi:gluconate kinase
MSRGELFTDADRRPWLQTMGEVIAQWLKADKNTILACYALKTNF